MRVPYLTGGEEPTAARMNTLFAALDAKMTRLLGGKSFFLAQASAPPQRLCGKAFFFTSGTAVYASRVPGWIDNGGNVTRPYNHAQFTNAVAGINEALVTWDETNKVANVPAFSSDAYDGLPQAWDTRLLGWSLEAHTLMHQGSSDEAPVPYYIREHADCPPEKHYRYTLVELILEGVTHVDFDAAWTKHACFRVHNLNMTAATVNFGGVYTMQLEPLACKTVRRDPGANANYREGWNYFLKFEAGDPRYYWFLPKLVPNAAQQGVAEGPAVTNSMAANNLSNPAIALDWVNYLTREMNGTGYGAEPLLAEANGWYAGWVQNPHEQCDVSEDYTNIFGDPNDEATLLGDLLHHKGDILIVRSHKTKKNSAGTPVITFDTVTFNGYATIVEDFAAKQLRVAENASHNYEITSTDPDHNVYLVPLSTNLLKSGDSQPTVVSLANGAKHTIESAVLETNFALSDQAPQQIFHPTLSTTANQRTWNNPVTGMPETFTGDPIEELDWGHARESTLKVEGVHRITVGDLLKLDFWGDPAVENQESDYVAITNRQLKLTPEGLVILYTETDSSIQAKVSPSQLDLQWSLGKRGLPTARTITFRNHGWGYFGPNGSWDSAFLSARVGRWRVDEPFSNDVVAPAGADYTLNAISGTETTVRILGRLKVGHYSLASRASRFWKATHPGDFTSAFVQARALRTQLEFETLFSQSTVAQLNDGLAPLYNGISLPQVKPALITEMYNALARAVNAVTHGTPLSWETLRWDVDGQSVGLTTALKSPRSDAYKGAWNAATNTPALPDAEQEAGDYYTVTTGGSTSLGGISSWAPGDVAFFDGENWYKNPPMLGEVETYATGMDPGVVPMDEFAHFNAGSLLHKLCLKLGIPVLTEADFPGGKGPDDSTKTFAFFKELQELNPIWWVGYNISLTSSGTVTGVDEGGGWWSASFNGQTAITGSITVERLNSADLFAGIPSGARCLGTYEGPAVSLNAADAYLRYFDGAKPGDFRVREDGQELAIVTNVLSSVGFSVRGVDPWATAGLWRKNFVGVAWLPNKQPLDLNQFAIYRWVRIADVQAAVEAYMPFAYFEQCLPLELRYFEETEGSTVEFERKVDHVVPFSDSIGLFNRNPEELPLVIEDHGYGAGSFLIAPAEDLIAPGWTFGAWSRMARFCLTADTDAALWKMPKQGVWDAGTGVSPPWIGSSPPARVVNLPALPQVTTLAMLVSQTPFEPLAGVNQALETNESWHTEVGWHTEVRFVTSAYAHSIDRGALGYVDENFTAVQVIRHALKDPDRLLQGLESESSLNAQYMALGFLTAYTTPEIAHAAPILASGVGVWGKDPHWWSTSMDTAIRADNPPPKWYGKPADRVVTVGNGLTIVSAAAGEKFLVLFSVASPQVNLE